MKRKMRKRLVCGFLAGFFVFLVLSIGGSEWLDRFFWESDLLGESVKLEQLQTYVDKHHIKASDALELRDWAYHNDIIEFVIVRKGHLLFDLNIQEEISKDGIQLLTDQWKNYMNVIEFADGDANVQLYDGRNEKYHDILTGIAVIVAIALGNAIFMTGLHEDMEYICYLEDEVTKIGLGNLGNTIAVQGEDELSRLASGLDSMRRMLIYREEKEREMRAAQDKLVLGMAHDLRTPLTGLMTYVEVLRKQEKSGKVDREYIEKAFDKILQIRSLSDQMFEYFLVFSKEKIELEPLENAESAFEDYLSEILTLLECAGFSVNVEEIIWHPVMVQINRNYIGRIINNLFSNIEKYGDRKRNVSLELVYMPDKIGISIKNGIALPNTQIEGTGIGLKNVSQMMYQMGGHLETAAEEDTFRTILWFPCSTNKSFQTNVRS